PGGDRRGGPDRRGTPGRGGATPAGGGGTPRVPLRVGPARHWSGSVRFGPGGHAGARSRQRGGGAALGSPGVGSLGVMPMRRTPIDIVAAELRPREAPAQASSSGGLYTVPVATDRDLGKAAGVVVPRAGVAGVSPSGDPLRANLALMAPGTALRDGLERILRGRTGALIVLGYDEVVESVCTGGFWLDVEFSATHLRELCKMDGAIILSSEGTRILRAGVHLMPDPNIPTQESGTRHRTAERVAKQTGFPVISVSQSMNLIGLYLNGQRHVLADSAAITSRANQALATLERYKMRFDEVSSTLSALEIEDLVTLRDAATVIQRVEMLRRIADEIAGYVVELGVDGRLLALQLDELMAGVDTERTLVVRDY